MNLLTNYISIFNYDYMNFLVGFNFFSLMCGNTFFDKFVLYNLFSISKSDFNNYISYYLENYSDFYKYILALQLLFVFIAVYTINGFIKLF